MQSNSTISTRAGTVRAMTPSGPSIRLAAFLAAIAAAASLFTTPAQATVPATMSYQGLLRDSGGGIVPDGQHGFVFQIFAGASGGSPRG
jgi:hypothetical protein